MTSPSRRNHQTTAWSALAGRTPTSLATLLLTAAAAVGQAPPPPNAAPASTTWAPPPPLPSATAPAYRPLQPADAPATRKAPAPAGPTRPVLTLQKPPGTDVPKDAPAPQAPPGSNDPKADRDPPKAITTPSGQTDPSKLFRLENGDDLLKRITGELLNEERDRFNRTPEKDREDRRPPDASGFVPPQAKSLAEPGVVYRPKTLSYPPSQALLEPGYVVHRRLYFEELNSERYGWEVGLAQPAISTLLFYKDTILFPAKLASHFGEWYDTSAGKCPPGSPVPYKVYPEQVDAFGLLVGTGAIVGTSAILGW